jgi:hypothetical protein
MPKYFIKRKFLEQKGFEPVPREKADQQVGAIPIRLRMIVTVE